MYMDGFRQIRLPEKLGDGLGVGVGGRFLLILRIGRANKK